MEVCTQCRKQAEKQLMVAVMRFDKKTAVNAIGVDPGKNWMAMPMCADCHQQPKLKAHYFRREDAVIALRLADMPTLHGQRL